MASHSTDLHADSTVGASGTHARDVGIDAMKALGDLKEAYARAHNLLPRRQCVRCTLTCYSTLLNKVEVMGAIRHLCNACLFLEIAQSG